MADERRRGTNRVVNGNKPDKTGLEKVLENWEVLPGIMVNPRHLHFMIFVESFDPCCHQRRHSLSRATLSFSHKYPAKNVSSFSPSFYCIVVHYSHDMYRSKGKKKKERKEIKEREREKTTTRYEDKARNVRITLKFAFKIFYVFFFLLFSSFFFFWFFLRRQISFIAFARYRVSYVYLFFFRSNERERILSGDISSLFMHKNH